MLLLHRIEDASSHPASAAQRCPEILETWLRFAPDSQPSENADFEDWAEPAHILHAMNAHGDVTIVPSHSGGFYDGDKTPLVPANPGAPTAIMWGKFQAADTSAFPIEANLMWNSAQQVRAVQNYAASPIFQRHVGRDFHICDITDPSISEAIVKLREAGHTKGFIKTRDKGMATPFTIPPTGTERLMFSANFEDPWMLVQREGDRGALYVQEGIQPTREYRIFVVGDQIITGAGCVEQHTPCDNEGYAFDNRIEIIRGDGNVVREQRTVSRYLAFAYAYAKAWAHEHGSDMGYSLDLCIDAATDKVQIVEMNPLANVGLYAVRADLIVSAMIDGAERLPQAA